MGMYLLSSAVKTSRLTWFPLLADRLVVLPQLQQPRSGGKEVKARGKVQMAWTLTDTRESPLIRRAILRALSLLHTNAIPGITISNMSGCYCVLSCNVAASMIADMDNHLSRVSWKCIVGNELVYLCQFVRFGPALDVLFRNEVNHFL